VVNSSVEIDGTRAGVISVWARKRAALETGAEAATEFMREGGGS
jgi:hypothetical protein